MQEQEFLKKVRLRAGLRDNDETKRDIEAVFQTLRARISPEGGENVGAQLPKELKEIWEAGTWGRISRWFTGTEHLDLGAFIARVGEEIGTDDMTHSEVVTRAVFTTFREQVTEGASHAVEAQLPPDIAEFWRECTPDRFDAMMEEGPPYEMEAPVVGETGRFTGPGVAEEFMEGPRTDMPSGPDVEMTIAQTEAQVREMRKPEAASEEECVVCEECGAMFAASEAHEHTWEEGEGVQPPAEDRVRVRPSEPAHPAEGPGSPEAYRSDAEMEEEVRHLLGESDEFDASRIDVFVQAGNVTLRGAVSSEDERDAAGRTAAQALAVGEIFNELEIEHHT